MPIQHIKQITTRLEVEDDLRFVEHYLGKGVIAQKFSSMDFNLGHLGLRYIVTQLAIVFRVAERYGIESTLTNQLLALDSFTNNKYLEIMQRYFALLIIEKETTDITQALPEYPVLDDKNPDWTIKTQTGAQLHVEVSAILSTKIADDLAAFSGQLQTSKTISASQTPLYFEVIFNDNPRDHDAAIIGQALVKAAKIGGFPTRFECDGAIINVDLLANRYTRQQIISDELNSTSYLKATRLMTDKLTYTLAAKIGLKSVERKIDEKKKSNKLDRIGNVWICIFIDRALSEIELDNATTERIRLRIKGSKWLRKVIISKLAWDPDESCDLQYYVIG